jgi:hypothetical protein
LDVAGQFVRLFTLKSSSFNDKVVLVVMRVFIIFAACFALFGTLRLGLMGLNVLGFRSVLLKSVSLCVVGGGLVILSKKRFFPFVKERLQLAYSYQQREEEMMQVFGGRKAYKQFPRLTADRVQNIQHTAHPALEEGPLIRIQMEDVRDSITVGVDHDNRPFIVLRLQNKNDLKRTISGCVIHRDDINRYWRNTRLQPPLFTSEKWSDCAKVLKSVVDNNHEIYRLV